MLAFVLLQEKLGAYFLSKMDSDNPKVQEVGYIQLFCVTLEIKG